MQLRKLAKIKVKSGGHTVQIVHNRLYSISFIFVLCASGYKQKTNNCVKEAQNNYNVYRKS